MRMVLGIAHQVEALAGSVRLGDETMDGRALGAMMTCLSEEREWWTAAGAGW
jgi:hypothetical protein